MSERESEKERERARERERERERERPTSHRYVPQTKHINLRKVGRPG